MAIHPVALLVLVLSPLLVSCVDDIAFFPENGHYYQLVTLSNAINYDQAKTLASSRSHNGKTGYIVTIGSASEQAFLSSYLNTLNVMPVPSIDYPTIWGAAVRSGNLWSWNAAGRVSNPIFDVSTMNCSTNAYCNWNDTSLAGFPFGKNCTQIYLHNEQGPTPGTWRSASCSNVSQALVIEYDPSQTCSPGYVYRTSKGWCEDVNECTNNPKLCGAGYQCVNTIGAYRCDDVNECLNTSICKTGYQCSNSNGSYSCVDLDECSQIPSVCQSGYDCKNWIGWYECIDINECTANSSLCNKGYVCQNKPGSYDCNDINECNQPQTPCPFGTKCQNTIGSYTCDSLYYQIQSEWNGLMMDYKVVNGVSRVITNTKSGSKSQLWSFTPEGFIVNGMNGYVVDAEGGNVYPGIKAILWPRKRIEQAGNQLWEYDANAKLWISAVYDVVLDIFQAQYTPQAEICLFPAKNMTGTPEGNANQKWSLVESALKP